MSLSRMPEDQEVLLEREVPVDWVAKAAHTVLAVAVENVTVTLVESATKALAVRMANAAKMEVVV